MEEIEVKWSHAAQIWWSWLWRTLLWTLPLSMGVGFVLGIIMALEHISVDSYRVPLKLIGGVIGLYFSIYTMKIILNKNFGGYRIALVKSEEAKN